MEAYDEISREDLYERAQELDIDGRSSMSKQALYDAVKKAEEPIELPQPEEVDTSDLPDNLHSLRALLDETLAARDHAARVMKSARTAYQLGGYRKAQYDEAVSHHAHLADKYQRTLTAFEAEQRRVRDANR